MGHHILVVDDDYTNLEVITELLEDEGHTTITAEAGEEALQQVKNHSFDLIILDWMMPGMSGIDVLSELKGTAEYRDIPVIMQTAKAYSENVVEGLEAGACHYLTKPFTKDVLLTMVKSSLAQKRRFSDISEKADKKVEEIKDSFFILAKRQKSTKLDLATYRQITTFFSKSLNCKKHHDLVELLLDSVKQFSFDSAGKDDSDRKLRCSIRLASDKIINLSDRGIESKFDTLVLQRAMDSGDIIQQGTYTAVPSKSGQTAIMIRNTPQNEDEAMKAIEIVSIMLEQFKGCLEHFENELFIADKNRELEKRADQIRNVVRSCSDQLKVVNDTYQEMKEKQMAILEQLNGHILQGISGLDNSQVSALKDVVDKQIINSMELYTADQITDQKFLNTIEQLNNLLAEKSTPSTPAEPSEFGGISQAEVDELLASLGI